MTDWFCNLRVEIVVLKEVIDVVLADVKMRGANYFERLDVMALLTCLVEDTMLGVEDQFVNVGIDFWLDVWQNDRLAAVVLVWLRPE